MTKEERRAEKTRMLVQSGALFHDAAVVLSRETELPHDTALQCVFVAEMTQALRGIRQELAEIRAAAEGDE